MEFFETSAKTGFSVEDLFLGSVVSILAHHGFPMAELQHRRNRRALGIVLGRNGVAQKLELILEKPRRLQQDEKALLAFSQMPIRRIVFDMLGGTAGGMDVWMLKSKK